MKELDFQNLIRLHIAKREDTTMFRNNVGMSWTGVLVSNKNGVVTLRNARPLHSGLFKGSSDLIGWRTTMIGGYPCARFVSLEIKTDKGRTTSEQEHWIDMVNKAGGIAGIIRSTEDVDRIL